MIWGKYVSLSGLKENKTLWMQMIKHGVTGVLINQAKVFTIKIH